MPRPTVTVYGPQPGHVSRFVIYAPDYYYFDQFKLTRSPNGYSFQAKQTNGNIMSQTYNPTPPAPGQVILGLKQYPRPPYPDEIVVTTDGPFATVQTADSLAFDEVWGAPPSDQFRIRTYKNASDPNHLDKSLTEVGYMEGTLRTETSLLDPEIVFEYATVPDFNYCFIPKFKRYYYVTGMTSVKKNLWRMTLHVDVLMTYKTKIRAQRAFVSRQQNVSGPVLLTDHNLVKGFKENLTMFPAKVLVNNVKVNASVFQQTHLPLYVLSVVDGGDF